VIELNGKKFAANENEFTASLFEGSGTCVGFYRVNKRTISLLNPQKEKVGVITCHRVLAKATKRDEGGFWHSYGDIKEVGKYESYLQETQEIQSVLQRFNIQVRRR